MVQNPDHAPQVIGEHAQVGNAGIVRPYHHRHQPAIGLDVVPELLIAALRALLEVTADIERGLAGRAVVVDLFPAVAPAIVEKLVIPGAVLDLRGIVVAALVHVEIEIKCTPVAQF